MPNLDNEQKAGSEAALLDGLIPVDVPVTLALARLLEPGDRRFMALGWAEGLYVYDGWTEYTLDDFSSEDLFSLCAVSVMLRAGNAHDGCGRTHILIDFAQGIIYTGDEACVESVLDEVVDQQYYSSLLAATLGSLAVGLPLTATAVKPSNGNIIIRKERFGGG